jgi:hypothetical protein
MGQDERSPDSALGHVRDRTHADLAGRLSAKASMRADPASPTPAASAATAANVFAGHRPPQLKRGAKPRIERVPLA